MEITTNTQMVETQLLENVDFCSYESAETVSQKVLHVILTEISAIGAQALECSVEIASKNMSWAESFLNNFKSACLKLKVKPEGALFLKSTGAAVIKVRATGESDAFLNPYGAQPGDLLCVSGMIGEAALGWYQRLNIVESETFIKSFEEKCALPVVRPRLGFALRNIATSCVSVYNGFMLGAEKIASNVSITINKEDLPICEAVRNNIDLVLRGRGDCELLFTLPPSKCHTLAALRDPVAIIGEVNIETNIKGVAFN